MAGGSACTGAVERVDVSGDDKVAGDEFVSEFAAPFRVPTAGVGDQNGAARAVGVNVKALENIISQPSV